MKFVSLGLFASAGIVAWLIWGPVLGFLYSLIPVTAEYAWAGKLIITLFVAWFGGIAVPIIFVAFGIFALVK